MVMSWIDLFRKKKIKNDGEIASTRVIKITNKVIAKVLSGSDTEYMYRSFKDIPGLCPHCRSRLEIIPNLNYSVKRTNADLLCTYDSYFIASEKFKRFCEENRYKNLKFVRLNGSNYYSFIPLGVFYTDISRNQFTKLGEWCDYCKTYTTITKAIFKRKNFILQKNDFILGTDNYWGSFEFKTPEIIIGTETMRKMKDFGLKGLGFHDVYE